MWYKDRRIGNAIAGRDSMERERLERATEAIPERAFAERTSAAIIVLLGFLLIMNLAAVIIRKRMERKW